ncbi:MAG: preprotein translocase subunit YajC [Phyllobacteriaceae bacterium]|nr:preprotein translocase subunit YajC [Nitratireductor sp.]MCO5135309.1 preprotein translocase subunit YajC [Phyllobacteriaceae bacterium]
MFVTPAYAQTAGGGGDLFMSILPFVLMFVIFYFLLIRPQRKQMQERKEMLANIRRNDTIVTGGGIVGKITKVIDDNEVEVEIAKDVKVRVMRSLVADVRVKGEPAK